MNRIVQADTKDQIGLVSQLFREYEAWLGLDLCFQGFEAELASLPGKYAPPDGRLFLAFSDCGNPAGCIALRKLGDGICEMKRLFLREAFRGQRLGQLMIEHLIAEAREIGYKKMRLDTYPPKMERAVHLYRSYGFAEVPPYYENPYDGVLFMELDLSITQHGRNLRRIRPEEAE